MSAPAHGHPVVVSDLSVEYPSHGASPAHVALRGIQFRLAPGEVLGVLGSAGSGKSTLAQVLSGQFLEPRSGEVRPVLTGGEVRVLGTKLQPMTRRRLAELRFHVGYLAQDAATTLPAEFTVAELVGAPILERDRRYERRALASRVATLIDAVRLPLTVLDRYPYELSGGQRQRVALARSLVLGPSLLIADEPTAGVDVTVRDAVAGLIGELREARAFSAIVVSHDLAVLRRITNRVAVLDRGSLVALGRIDEVFADPIHPYVRALGAALDEGRAAIGERDSGSAR
ncbi:ABC transporter ATP-binding protein [Agromyces intestinalis]|uniref:ABC transporter ATP-binding protein n=1 Tax=Agromyces intestinalis TaxID=2592652 RepID=A0A5C1YAV9_9MICO|nr:dipeptide/oligopeptide/nickel ABC transporter ATP-binding protein [Agromyces intestinalis]QEO13121.1 ABC transporter ATP-binding protein [Agromyces intestinalis]